MAALVSDGTTTRTISISDNSISNFVYLEYRATENVIRYHIYTNGAEVSIYDHTLSNATEFNKFAVRWADADFSFWVNGIEVHSDSIGNTFAPNVLNTLLFDRFNSSAPFYGNAKSLMVFPSALTDAELATLTTL